MSFPRIMVLFTMFGALGALLLFSGDVFRKHTLRASYGFTFSSMYAESLELNASEVLSALLKDFHPAFLRLPLYWDAIETASGSSSWQEVDVLVNKAIYAQVPLHMVIGAKVPRWPECFVPDWVDVQDERAYRASLLSYVREGVMRYAPVIDVWQVENEPLFTFGKCSSQNISLLQEEIALVRALDPTARIQITVSGEQQAWGSVASLADRIGVSMYRNVQSPWFGSLSFPVPVGWYSFMRLPFLFSHDLVISELQMEPWFTRHPLDTSLEAAVTFFTVQDALHNLAYARATGFSEISLWGVEWWYYLRQHGYPALWDAMSEELKR